MKIAVSPAVEDKNYQVITFSGEFDKAGQSEIKDELTKAVKETSRAVVIFDFSDLKFINSEGIGYLMEIHTHLINKDKKLIIVGLKDNVKDVFGTIGINDIIPIHASLDAYLKSL